MSYSSLEEALLDLEKNGMLLRIREAVSPTLVMPKIAEIATRESLPALLFERVEHSPFRAAANIFGTRERARFLFRDSLDKAKTAIGFYADPVGVLKRPSLWPSLPGIGLSALPLRVHRAPVLSKETNIQELPQVKCHRDDGGAFLTLPQVFSQMPGERNILKSNLGMYRVQISGNDYNQNNECGLHYQIERDIERHHEAALRSGKPFKVSIWLGGPPAHTIAAIMPLPPDVSEILFAGLLGKRRFRYTELDGWKISADADFCLLGELAPELKPEGPFGDHIGYYSAKHEFPCLKIKRIFCKENAIYPFTTVGRPPQEDSIFGELIGELAAPMVPHSVPGVSETNAVDAAGVHSLLLAIGHERYRPYLREREPMELLKEANAILGFNQASLAKYLFIAAREDSPDLDTHKIIDYFIHILERIHLDRDVHLQTKTTIDTLDYSGSSLDHGSKAVFAVAGKKIRELGRVSEDLAGLELPTGFSDPRIAFPGALSVRGEKFAEPKALADALGRFGNREKFPLVTIADDSLFTARSIDNWLWVTFTRSDPAADLYGAHERFEKKHWRCESPLLIDARMKPQMQPPIEDDPATETRAREILERAKRGK